MDPMERWKFSSLNFTKKPCSFSELVMFFGNFWKVSDLLKIVPAVDSLM